ncbi:hypothetical protein CgunFtcFv8_016873 [Champsocephalus gunnari]|uniref:Uncharacterized protein n=1 Tax=Champsocephalus gunnari TaxID=52237 RepID=A0AAN8CUV8_CHAGU|nr:hypothetical protein CgunFtcFv8_016873 [Champsocephalus gunnari]
MRQTQCFCEECLLPIHHRVQEEQDLPIHHRKHFPKHHVTKNQAAKMHVRENLQTLPTHQVRTTLPSQLQLERPVLKPVFNCELLSHLADC